MFLMLPALSYRYVPLLHVGGLLSTTGRRLCAATGVLAVAAVGQLQIDLPAEGRHHILDRGRGARVGLWQQVPELQNVLMRIRGGRVSLSYEGHCEHERDESSRLHCARPCKSVTWTARGVAPATRFGSV